MTMFTPLSAAIGGALILAPIAGALAGHALATPAMPASEATVIAAGVLVGFGTRLASGCTSGHGVCGIARLTSCACRTCCDERRGRLASGNDNARLSRCPKSRLDVNTGLARRKDPRRIDRALD